MGLLSFLKSKSTDRESVKCYSYDRSTYVTVFIDDTTVYYKDKVIGEFQAGEADTVKVSIVGNEISFVPGEFVTFINNSKNRRLASGGNSVCGGDLVGPMVEVNGNYVSTVEGDLLASFNGDASKALAAFVCVHAIVFDGLYHDYFVS